MILTHFWKHLSTEPTKSEIYPRLDITGSTIYTNLIDKFEPLKITFEFMGTTHTIFPQRNVPKYENDLVFQFSQKLFAGGRITESIKYAKIAAEQSLIEKEMRVRNIALSVIKAYWELRRAEMLVQIENITWSRLDSQK